jgi:hypothetical protein
MPAGHVTIHDPLRIGGETIQERGPVSVSSTDHARIFSREVSRGLAGSSDLAGSIDLVSTLT